MDGAGTPREGGTPGEAILRPTQAADHHLATVILVGGQRLIWPINDRVSALRANDEDADDERWRTHEQGTESARRGSG